VTACTLQGMASYPGEARRPDLQPQRREVGSGLPTPPEGEVGIGRTPAELTSVASAAQIWLPVDEWKDDSHPSKILASVSGTCPCTSAVVFYLSAGRKLESGVADGLRVHWLQHV